MPSTIPKVTISMSGIPTIPSHGRLMALSFQSAPGSPATRCARRILRFEVQGLLLKWLDEQLFGTFSAKDFVSHCSHSFVRLHVATAIQPYSFHLRWLGMVFPYHPLYARSEGTCDTRIPTASRLLQPTFDTMSHGHDGNREYIYIIWLYIYIIYIYGKISTYLFSHHVKVVIPSP